MNTPLTPKEKAEELIEKYKPYMYCYMGSGMLSNTYDEEVVLDFAKKCTIIAVDEVIKQWEYIDTYLADLGGELNPNLKYWYQVKEDLESCRLNNY